MKSEILPIKNISRLKSAGDALVNRTPGQPGIGLVMGPTGYGKSTGTTWYCVNNHGVYVRAVSLWTPKAMLTAIAGELEIEVTGRLTTNAFLLDAVADALTESRRPLFIDEADYVVEKRQLVNVLRDIHDMSTVPVVLVGMHGIEKKIKDNEQFTGRIAQWVKFEGLDVRDARMIADGLCDIRVEEDLLNTLYTDSCPKVRGNITGGAEVRRLIVGLNNIEKWAKKKGLMTIALEDWPRGESFFIGQPVSVPPAPKAPAPKASAPKPLVNAPAPANTSELVG